MGRFFTKPIMNQGFESAPKLKWYKLYYKNTHAGDILASFELVYKKVSIFDF